MKKVVENNNENSCKISDESSCDISGNDSDTGLTIRVNEENQQKIKRTLLLRN